MMNERGVLFQKTRMFDVGGRLKQREKEWDREEDGVNEMKKMRVQESQVRGKKVVVRGGDCGER